MLDRVIAALISLGRVAEMPGRGEKARMLARAIVVNAPGRPALAQKGRRSLFVVRQVRPAGKAVLVEPDRRKPGGDHADLLGACPCEAQASEISLLPNR